MGTTVPASGESEDAGEEAGRGEEDAEGEGAEKVGAVKPPVTQAPTPWIVAIAALAVAGALLIALIAATRREPAPVPAPPASPVSDERVAEGTTQPEGDSSASLFRGRERTSASRDPLRAIDPLELEFADAFKAARSVYLLVERIGKTERVRGTAWVAASGILATSARAAGAPGKRDLLVRSSGHDPVTLQATTIQLHPGFGTLSDIAGEYMPVLHGENRRGQGLPPGRPCDVALLAVGDTDADRLGPPLTLAAGATTAGGRVCTVGYESSEDHVLVLQRPQVSLSFGSILSLLDVFGNPTDPATTDLIRHALPAFAGAAGSPVLSNQGEVLAMLSEGTRSAGQFAVPAAIVAELVENRADAAQALRRKRWHTTMRTYESRLALLRQELLADWEGELGESAARVFRSQEVVRAVASQPDGESTARASVMVDEVGPVLVLVASRRAVVGAGAERSAVALKATVTEVREGKTKITHECRPLGAHGLYEFLASARFRTKGKTELEITATSDDLIGTQVDITVYRAVERERQKPPPSQEAPASQHAPASQGTSASQDIPTPMDTGAASTP